MDEKKHKPPDNSDVKDSMALFDSRTYKGPSRIINTKKESAIVLKDVFRNPTVPHSISMAIKLFDNLCDKGMLGASKLFNLLVPNSRSYKPDKHHETWFEKYMPVSLLPKNTPLVLKHIEARPPSNDDICFVTTSGKAYLLKDLVEWEIDRLKKTGFGIKSETDKIVAYLDKLIKYAVVTAQGYPPKTNIVATKEALDNLEKLILSNKTPLILDIETGGLDPFSSEIVGIGLSLNALEGYYIPITSPKQTHAHDFSQDINNSIKPCKASEINHFVREVIAKSKIVAHNAKFEYQFFKAHYGISLGIIHDTMIGEYILDCRLKGRFNLGASIKERFPLMEEWKESKDFFKNIINLPISQVATYCVKDCCNEYLLFMAQFAPLVKDFDYIANFVDMPFIKVVAEAELEGFNLDENYLKKLHTDLNAQVAALDTKIKQRLGDDVNIDSARQLGDSLFNKHGFVAYKKTAGGAPSVDADAIEQLRNNTKDELFDWLLERRSLQKLAATYTLSFIEKRNKITTNVHPTFAMTNTETGRLACTNPNF